MTLNKIYGKLRRYNRKNYLLLTFCILLSVSLITSYAMIYFSPTVQNFLPQGGDSRKMGTMIFAAAILGCGIFTVYASSLFLKYKSREMGIFMAIGARKRQLRSVLFTDIGMVTASSSLLGLALGIPVSRGVWGLFQLLIVDTREMRYQFAPIGLGVGAAFAAAVTVCCFIQAVAFLKRSNIMEILNDHRKSEPVRDVKGWYGGVGIGLVILGFLLGYFGYDIFKILFSRRPPALWGLTYLLAVAGVYMTAVYLVVHGKKGRNPQRYYKNIISISMMRFMGRQTVRNICVIVLLVFGGLFAVIYVPGIWTQNQEVIKNMPVDCLFTYPAGEQQITEEEIQKLADTYQTEVKNYRELEVLELIVDGTEEIYDKDGRITETYIEREASAMFLKAGDISRITGSEVKIPAGSYGIGVKRAYKHTKGEKRLLLTDPSTGNSQALTYGGNVLFDASLVNDLGNIFYVLNDQEFDNYSSRLKPENKYVTAVFDVDNWKETYAFASALKKQIILRTSKAASVYAGYNNYVKYRYESQGIPYFMDEEYPPGEGSLKMDPENSMLSTSWRYYPQFKVLLAQDMLKNMSVYIMLFVYIAIVCLTAVGVIAYTRGVSIGINYKQVFVDLQRLGASHTYIRFCIRSQLRKIFFFPYFMGVAVSLFYMFLIYWQNDGIITSAETRAIGVILLAICLIFGYIYLVYRAADRKFQHLVGIREAAGKEE